MKLTPSGIVIYPAELRALLRFCDSDAKRPESCVHFRCELVRLVAYATDGSRALQAVGPLEGDKELECPEGEWTVARAFLDLALQSLSKDRYLLLCISGATMDHAEINDGETNEIVATLNWPTDAASTQMTFPTEELKKQIVLPTTEHPIRCISVNAKYMADLAVVASAAGSGHLDLFVPKSRQDGIVFSIEEEGMTAWRGVMMPLRERPTSETDDGTENRQGELRGKGKGKAKSGKQPELRLVTPEGPSDG